MTLLFLHLHGHQRKLADREANEEKRSALQRNYVPACRKTD